MKIECSNKKSSIPLAGIDTLMVLEEIYGPIISFVIDYVNKL